MYYYSRVLSEKYINLKKYKTGTYVGNFISSLNLVFPRDYVEIKNENLMWMSV